MDVRQESLRRLSAAVSNATAGELIRAEQMLKFARDVRTGKHDLRRKGRERLMDTVHIAQVPAGTVLAMSQPRVLMTVQSCVSRSRMDHF